MPDTPQLPDYKAFSIHHPASLKPVRQGLVYGVVWLLLRLAGRLSLRRLQGLGRWLGRTAYRLSKRQRRLCHVQLEMVYPELSQEEHTRIARTCMEHQGMTLLETMALPRLRKSGAPWLRLENAERFVEAHAQGRGVVLVTAHLANWELLPIALERLRIKAVAVASTLNNPKLNALVGSIRRFEYMDVAERGSETSARALLSCLKRGEVLILVNDVDIEAQGVFVDFFGIPANTPRAPASLALKRGAPLLVYFDERLPDGSHVLRFDEVPVTDAIRAADDPVKALTQAVTARTEAEIRRRPEQWMWNHRRWKRRPAPEGAQTPSGVPSADGRT